MGTLFVILVSGVFVSLIFMAYLIISTHDFREKPINGDKQGWRQKKSNVNWLGILLFSTGVFYSWCLIGIGMQALLNNDALVERLSLFGLAVGMLICLVKIIRAFQKYGSVSSLDYFHFRAYSHGFENILSLLSPKGNGSGRK